MDAIPVVEVLKNCFAISDCMIKVDHRGNGINYWINDAYFLKVFTDSVKYRIEDEIAVCAFLRSRGFPTSEFLPTVEGRYIQKTGAYRCHMQKRISGVAHEGNSLCFDECILLIKRLKQIIELLSDCPFETNLNMLFAGEFVKADIMNAILKRSCDAESDLLPILRRKSDLLDRVRFQTGKIQHAVLSHSDYHVQQILTTELQIKSLEDIKVIDFSHVSKVPIEWEIIRACLRSMEFDREASVAAIVRSLEIFERVVPMCCENLCIAVIQLISSSYTERMYRSTHQQAWLERTIFELDVLEKVYECVR